MTAAFMRRLYARTRVGRSAVLGPAGAVVPGEHDVPQATVLAQRDLQADREASAGKAAEANDDPAASGAADRALVRGRHHADDAGALEAPHADDDRPPARAAAGRARVAWSGRRGRRSSVGRPDD